METIRILLVDSKNSAKALLEKQLLHADGIKSTVSVVGVKGAGNLLAGGSEAWDVVLFGETLPPTAIAQLAKSFRRRGFTMPIFILTRESEARVSRTLRKAGVDDVLNLAEIDTPLFSWTFMSTLKQSQVQRKAKEFDAIRERLRNAHRSLAGISHEMNNPLSVMRLAVYHLKNPKLTKSKRDTFTRILADNLRKMESTITDLKEVRQQLGEDTSVLTRMILTRSLRESG